jgi:hypothetical protein
VRVGNSSRCLVAGDQLRDPTGKNRKILARFKGNNTRCPRFFLRVLAVGTSDFLRAAIGYVSAGGRLVAATPPRPCVMCSASNQQAKPTNPLPDAM